MQKESKETKPGQSPGDEKQKETTYMKPEEMKDWPDYLKDFIKNPIVTLVGGLGIGYVIGANKANSELKAMKEEHQRQMLERDEQFGKLVGQIHIMSKRIESSMKSLPEKKDDLELEEDPSDKTYKLKGRKQFKLSA